jgi:hypothetical protein
MSEGWREGTLDSKPERSWPDKIVSLAARRASKALCQAAGDCGWGVRPGAPQWTPRTPLHLDLLDRSGKQTVTGVVNWEDLHEIEGSTQALSSEETTNALTGILAEADTASTPALEERGRRNEMLISLAARYVVKTETFRRIPAGTANAHGIILIYRPRGPLAAKGLLRPFAPVAREHQGLLGPRALTELSQPVIEQDRRSHPDWRPLAQVSPIHPRRS